jgi:membrane protease YdiL (CAAX protease family)
MAGDIHFILTTNESSNAFWNRVLYWPCKLVVVTSALYILWRLFHRGQPFYGLTTRNLHTKIYFTMLLVMIPLIAAAATQPDFLAVYPRLQNVQHLLEENSGWKKLLYELSYGSDFFTIELFFRGFLVLAFAKWTGKDAVLPMALFYCSIHFGKPLGECISSFFGGIILGVVIYHTRSIYGGLIVHLGIAWLMELGGYAGNKIFF